MFFVFSHLPDECRSRRSFKMMHSLLETLNQNPFFSGGLSLMVLGARRRFRNCPASSGA